MLQRHQDSIEHTHRFRRLKSALRAEWSRPAMALYGRLQKCGGPDWGHRYTCRTAACPVCRDRYIAAQRRAAERRWAGAENSELALLSIVLGATQNVEEIGQIAHREAKNLRNRIAAERRASGLWGPFEAVVWLEVDAIDLEDFARLGPAKREQVGEWMTVMQGQTGVVWLPSWHGIVRLGPALDVGQVGEAFRRQWPGHRQVHLRPFHVDRALTANISGVINYGNKHACTTDYYDAETGEITPREWDTSWLGTYYAWLHGWSRGFQSLRVSVRAAKPKRVLDLTTNSNEEIELEPLPFVHSSSHFDRDYIYWS